jgi:hypothetical protein
MGKSVSNGVLDAALDEIATCTRIDVTSDVSTPTNLTNTLANDTMIAGDGNGDYTIADGDVSGRKVTMTQRTDISVTASGTARHIVLSLGGTIKLTTTCVEQSLTSGNTVTIPNFKDEIQDPT